MLDLLLIPLVERKLECTKIHGPSEMVAQFYATPYFPVHKKVFVFFLLYRFRRGSRILKWGGGGEFL